jgi:hypothetical protein
MPFGKPTDEPIEKDFADIDNFFEVYNW